MRNKKFEQITRRSFCRLTLNALYINTTLVPVIQEPIVRLLNLQLQRQRCGRLARFYKVGENKLFSKRARLVVAL
jgi:hypothetical protein